MAWWQQLWADRKVKVMLRFDDFRLDPAALQVFRNDVPLDAPPQVVDVLA